MVRRISAVLAALALTTGYAFGSYGTRSVLYPLAVEQQVAPETAVLGVAVATLLGSLVAPLPGALLGPSGTAALGLVLAGVGAALAPTSLIAGAPALGFGIGLVRPALFAMVARPFARQPFAVAAAAVGVYLAVNLGALFGPLAGGSLVERAPLLVGPLFASALGLAAAFGLVDALVQWLAADPPEPRPAGRWVAIGTGAAVAAGLALAASTVGDAGRYALEAPYVPWVDPLNVASVLVVGVPLAIGLAVLAALDVRVALGLVGGLGVAAAGAVLVAAVPSISAAPVGGQAVVAFAGGAIEPLAWPLLQALAVREVPWRLSTALAAIPAVASAAVGLAVRAAPAAPWMAPAAGVLLVVLGVALAAAAIPADRWAGASPA